MPIDISYFNLIKLDAIPSTNSFLKEMLAKKELQRPTVVWTKNQTRGRGQREHRWISQPNKNLTLSIYSPLKGIPATAAFAISAGIALEIEGLLTQLGLTDVSVKWPNDILSCSKKIAGILIENFITGSAFTGVLMGVGINVNQTAFEGLPNATAITLNTAAFHTVEGVGNRFLERMAQFLSQLPKSDTKAIIDRYNAKMFGRNTIREFYSATTRFQGRLLGVNALGQLLIERNGTQFTDSKQELRIRY